MKNVKKQICTSAISLFVTDESIFPVVFIHSCLNYHMYSSKNKYIRLMLVISMIIIFQETLTLRTYAAKVNNINVNITTHQSNSKTFALQNVQDFQLMLRENEISHGVCLDKHFLRRKSNLYPNVFVENTVQLTPTEYWIFDTNFKKNTTSIMEFSKALFFFFGAKLEYHVFP